MTRPTGRQWKDSVMVRINSNGTFCEKPKEHRAFWRVVDRNCNYSAFNGYRRTPSAWSSVVCLETTCRGHWRTKAAYVDDLPNRSQNELLTGRADEPKVDWYCHTCGTTHKHTVVERDTHRDDLRRQEAAKIDGTVRPPA